MDELPSLVIFSIELKSEFNATYARNKKKKTNSGSVIPKDKLCFVAYHEARLYVHVVIDSSHGEILTGIPININQRTFTAFMCTCKYS